MEIVGVLGIVVAIIVIIYLAVKGYNVIIAAPIATLIVIIANQMNVFDAFFNSDTSYMSGLAGFIASNFAIFLLGAILGQYMDKSNATVTIANFILDKVGVDNPYRAMVAIAAIAALLTYGGISVFVVVFTLIPLARPIFKKLNVNWALFLIPLSLGMSTFTMSMMPGTPSIQNAVPISVLGTSLTASPILGIVGSVVVIIFGLWYMRRELNKSLANNETFYSYLGDGQAAAEKDESANEQTINEDELPGIFISILPLIVMIATILIFSQVENIIIIALSAAIVLSAILYNKYIPSQKEALNAAVTSSVPSAFATSSTVAFGSVLTSAGGFSVIRDAILNIPGNPLVGLSIATALLSGITGSASGAISIAANSFGQAYLDMGIAADVIHRITVTAGGVLTVMPHSGVLITITNLTGIPVAKNFKYQFTVVGGGHLLALIAMLLTTTLLGIG